MPIFHLRVINSDFEARDDLEAVDIRDAMKQGLRAALQIGSDEICNGKPYFGGEVCVEHSGGRKERFLVSIGQSPLKKDR